MDKGITLLELTQEEAQELSVIAKNISSTLQFKSERAERIEKLLAKSNYLDTLYAKLKEFNLKNLQDAAAEWSGMKEMRKCCVAGTITRMLSSVSEEWHREKRWNIRKKELKKEIFKEIEEKYELPKKGINYG